MTTSPEKGATVTVSRDDLLSYIHLLVNGEEYLHDTNSIHAHSQSQKVRNHQDYPIDVEPQSTIQYGGEVKFLFGRERAGLLTGLTLRVKLPAFTGGNAITGDTINMWKPFIGEAILGEDSENIRQMYSTNILRDKNQIGMHVQRRLCQSSIDFTRSVYLAGVKDEAQSNLSELWVQIPIQLGQLPDRRCIDCPLAVYAFGAPHEFIFKLPRLAKLIWSNATASNIAARESNVPEMHLRCHYKAVEKSERIGQNNLIHNDVGLTLLNHHIERERPVTVVGGEAKPDLTIEIKNCSQPCAFIAVVCRMADDMKGAGETATHDDALVPSRTNGSGVVNRPDATRLQLIDNWWITDGSQRVTPKFDRTTFYQSINEGPVSRFVSDLTGDNDRFALFLFSERPYKEEHCLGHQGFRGMQDPRIHLSLPTLLGSGEDSDAGSELAAMVRQIDVLYFVPNQVHMRNGQAFRTYNLSA